MIRSLATAALLLATVACGSSDPVGRYSVTPYLTSGNCPAAEGRTFALEVRAGGVTGHVMSVDGVAGTCPLEATDDGRYRASCAATSIDGTTGTTEYLLEFSGSGFTGDTSERYTGRSGCIGTYRLVGTRAR